MAEDETTRSDLPVARVLRVSRRHLLKFILPGFLIAIGSWVRVLAGQSGMWFPLIFFGLCSIVGVALLITPGRLTISSDQLTVHHLGRTFTYAFAECGEFAVRRIPMSGKRFVVFDYPGQKLERLNRKFSGGSASLPDTYGLRAEELAAILNHARDSRSERAT